MTFRLGCVIPAITDGTSFYRAAGPLQALEQSGDTDLRLETGGTINWVYLRGVNAVFMQRPYNADHVRVMSYAKLNGKPVWIDYDDDLYSVPMQNPTFKQYSPKAIQNNISSLIAQADIISVSTNALAEKIRSILERVAAAPENGGVSKKLLNPEKVVVVPNAYDEELFSYSFRDWDKQLPPANLSALWRGSHTHEADLSAFTMPLAQAFLQNGWNWTLNFVGSPWWGTIRHLEEAGVEPGRIVVTAPLDPIEYFHFLHHVKPAFVHVPLMDDPFNRSKSNIGWIEATHAGAVCLAPDWDEWRRPGVINYKNGDDFRNKVSMLLQGKVDRDALVKASRDFIRDNLTLARTNEIRGDIIDALRRIDPWGD